MPKRTGPLWVPASVPGQSVDLRDRSLYRTAKPADGGTRTPDLHYAERAADDRRGSDRGDTMRLHLRLILMIPGWPN